MPCIKNAVIVHFSLAHPVEVHRLIINNTINHLKISTVGNVKCQNSTDAFYQNRLLLFSLVRHTLDILSKNFQCIYVHCT